MENLELVDVDDEIASDNCSSSDDESIDSNNNQPFNDDNKHSGGTPINSPVRKKTRQEKTQRRSQHSIAHQELAANNCILVHVDIESGGDKCGIVQLSYVTYDTATRKTLVNSMSSSSHPPVPFGATKQWQCTVSLLATKGLQQQTQLRRCGHGSNYFVMSNWETKWGS